MTLLLNISVPKLVVKTCTTCTWVHISPTDRSHGMTDTEMDRVIPTYGLRGTNPHPLFSLPRPHTPQTEYSTGVVKVKVPMILAFFKELL